MAKIAHLTSAHTRYDIRIYRKQCKTLAEAGHEVYLVVADGKGDELKDGVHILDVGTLPGRLNRMFKTTRKIFERALALQADIYQFHDPELIPVGLKLKKTGKKVVFDSHEDVPKQLLSKPYLRPLSRRVLATVFAAYEKYACRQLDAVLTATPHIRQKFKAINDNVLDINNFPMLGELDAMVPWTNKKGEVCYVGGITSIRGISEVVSSLELLKSPARLNLVGRFSEPAVERDVKAKNGWKKVNEHGQLDRAEVREVLGNSVAGLVTFYPLPNHVDAQPNKMFEYMSSGIPVIASNFPLWREIIEGSNCGLCVDPLKPEKIAEAIDFLVTHPEEAAALGRNGQRAVNERYNWDLEGRKLMQFYSDLLDK
ncbi:glycosyltransferase WbpH [Pseudomonas sp. BR1R-5]|uniref:glycosyltransferase family 4 protein n=1 Tax=Pseudomonas sp. BR1R-5 TaxID=3003626 RepID=UPI0022C985DF|nr:glycosyltransferase family 4 protein [Pseudomonas sp. BR1R-5]GLH30793.1 glycosyltransferase WbpH [Pseudomonas sp. BR1R-5]